MIPMPIGSIKPIERLVDLSAKCMDLGNIVGMSLSKVPFQLDNRGVGVGLSAQREVCHRHAPLTVFLIVELLETCECSGGMTVLQLGYVETGARPESVRWGRSNALRYASSANEYLPMARFAPPSIA